MPRIYARISEDLKEKAKKRAHELNQVKPSGKANISGYVRYLIQEDIKNLKEENKMYRIDFGAFDDNRNFDWKAIRKEMQPFEGFTGDLGEITFDSREEAEEMLNRIGDYVDISIIEIVEEIS